MPSPTHPKIWHSKYALAELSRKDYIRLALTTLLLSFGFAMFHLMGSVPNSVNQSRSVLVWLVDRWNDSGISMGSGDYSHGFLVPFASLYVIWINRDEFIRAPKKMSYMGLGFVCLALLGHYMGVKIQHARLSILSLIGLSWAIPFYLFGWQIAKRLIFPCSFLIFAVPLNFLDGLTYPLRKINSQISVEVLQFLGLDVKQVGTAIYGPPYNESASLKLDVADPCSGIRSLTAMMALTAIYGYLVLQGIWRKWVLFLAAIPLAMAGNIFRIVSIGIMAEAINTHIATGIPHDYAGFIVFGCAIALMVSLSFFLKKDFTFGKKA
ncbi:exosortase/archaeosortase family protein [Kiritimatiellota bacterium B12222]|nr:exosortase/archaeosortase family protein [Kiritimatiellota bacterium B12222]